MSGTSILPLFSPEGGGGRGVLRISSDRDDQRIFWGFKFSILGFFWVGKFWQVFFLGSLISAFWKLLWLGKVGMEIFFGVKFWFRNIFGFWFLPPFDHPCHLKSEVPPWELSPSPPMWPFYFKHIWGGDLQRGGPIQFSKVDGIIFHTELEHKVERVRFIRLEVMQSR